MSVIAHNRLLKNPRPVIKINLQTFEKTVENITFLYFYILIHFIERIML